MYLMYFSFANNVNQTQFCFRFASQALLTLGQCDSPTVISQQNKQTRKVLQGSVTVSHLQDTLTYLALLLKES